MTATLLLQHLCFTGPQKPTAKLEFTAGLNVIYGASDTGKSFVLEAIDFMLGGGAALRDIPERVGYDRIFLGLETAGDGAKYTLVRAATGGQYQLYEGLHESLPPDVQPKVLAALHSAKKKTNVSRFLLGGIDLDAKSIRTNARNETRMLSFRDLARLTLISETDIQKRGSPIETPNVVTNTAEYSAFKLLLTGVDDSALVAGKRELALSQSRTAKIELIDELIAGYRHKVAETDGDQQELTAQLQKLTATIDRVQGSLRATEEQFQALVRRKAELRLKLSGGAERRAEIDELRARFALLDQHYQSDLDRLQAIREAGSLMAVLPAHTCPLCGAPPREQHSSDDTDGNLGKVVEAANAESAKIVQLGRELQDTVRQLGVEAESFDRLLPRLRGEIEKLDDGIEELRPSVVEQRIAYSTLIEKRASLNGALALFDQLAELEARKQALEGPGDREAGTPEAATDLSTTTLDAFAQQVEALLKKWTFPEAERVHFDTSTKDLVIQGKQRSSRGKGMRAVTHAAFTLGLMEFCRAKTRQHPGFVVLDSPLLAYRPPESEEPEGAEDDLRDTNVQEKFYEYLLAMQDRQVIVIENVTPPAAVTGRPNTYFFSKNQHQGRYGFFPPLPADPDA